MNPSALEFIFKAGTFLFDKILTEEKPETGEIKTEKKKFDPNATLIQNAAATVQARKLSVKKGGRSVIVTAIGAALYFVVGAGYISPASMQCMIDAAGEVEQAVQEKQVEQ